MVNDFNQFAADSEMLYIFSSGDVKAYYGQPEMDQNSTFRIVHDINVCGNPVFIYDWASKCEDFLRINKGNLRGIYNNYDDVKLGKLAVLRKLAADGVNWLPKTAFTADPGWDGITFPAICKAANSYDSKGVEKIDNKTDVPDYIDIVQEIIPIDREFRVIAFRGKCNDRMQILQLLEKTPLNDKAKDLRVSESLSKAEMKERPNTKFKWTILDPSIETDLMPDISKIVRYLFADNPGLNLAGFDIAFDGDGKGWYIEHNLIPAPIGPMFLLLYAAMFEDWYQRPVCADMRQRMNSLAEKYCKGTSNKVELEWDDPMPDPIDIPN